MTSKIVYQFTTRSDKVQLSAVRIFYPTLTILSSKTFGVVRYSHVI